MNVLAQQSLARQAGVPLDLCLGCPGRNSLWKWRGEGKEEELGVRVG